MSNLRDPNYDAVSASHHHDGSVPSQPWMDTSQCETHENAPWSCNAEPLNSQTNIYFHAQGSNMPQCGSGLGMERKTAIPGLYPNHRPRYPNPWNSSMWEPLASSGPFQPLGNTSSLISVEMQRQPANIGYEPWLKQGQDLNNNDGWEMQPFEHDTTREFQETFAIPARRQRSNMDNNWSLHRLPRPASKWVSTPWHRILNHTR